MINILKYTYLLDNRRLEESLEGLWKKYQKILDKKESDWEIMNEARAILYCIGFVFPEIIALGSLERRVKFLKPKISLDDFLLAIDSKNEKILSKYEKNRNFQELKKFYEIVKSIKNRANRDSLYLDEETFNKAYAKYRPKDYF